MRVAVGDDQMVMDAERHRDYQNRLPDSTGFVNRDYAARPLLGIAWNDTHHESPSPRFRRKEEVSREAVSVRPSPPGRVRGRACEGSHSLAFRPGISAGSIFVKPKHFLPRSFKEAPIR